MRAEILKKQVQGLMAEHSIKDIETARTHPNTKNEFEQMQSTYAEIHRLGFRQMPKEMYVDWLLSVDEEKYKNTKMGY